MKTLKIFIYANVVFLISLIIYSLIIKNYVAAISNIVGIPIILSFIILEKYKNIKIPLLLHCFFVIFIVSSISLGTTLNFYKIFIWWDKYLHTFSGILISFFGYYLVSYLDKNTKTSIKILFGFLFPLSLGVFWEIYEYSVDNLFGLALQHHSLDDTMGDLIVATIGSIIGLIIYFILLKKDKIYLIEN